MNQSITPIALIAFPTQAKRHIYATQGDQASVTLLLLGARQLEFRANPWLYRDIFFVSAGFMGQETVYYVDTPLWVMGYTGGMLDVPASPWLIKSVNGFLCAATDSAV